MQVGSFGWEDPLEKDMAVHSSIHAWRTHGQRSLVGYSPWGNKQSDMIEATEHTGKSLPYTHSLRYSKNVLLAGFSNFIKRVPQWHVGQAVQSVTPWQKVPFVHVKAQSRNLICFSGYFLFGNKRSPYHFLMHKERGGGGYISLFKASTSLGTC